MAYRLYLEIQAGRPMPEDETVYHNCGLIRVAEDRYNRSVAQVAAVAGTLAANKAASANRRGR